MREERERRNLENERYQLTRDLERVECELPYEAECLLLTQTIQYLQKIIEEPGNNTSEKEKTDEDDANVSNNDALPIAGLHSSTQQLRAATPIPVVACWLYAFCCSWRAPCCPRASARKSSSTLPSRKANTARTMKKKRKNPRCSSTM